MPVRSSRMVQPRDQMSADVVASSFDMISGATAESDIDAQG